MAARNKFSIFTFRFLEIFVNSLDWLTDLKEINCKGNYYILSKWGNPKSVYSTSYVAENVFVLDEEL